MLDPGEDDRVLEDLAAGVARLMSEERVAGFGKLNAQRCLNLAREIGNRYGYDGKAIWLLIGVQPLPHFHMECGACGRWANSDEVLTDMTHENFDGVQISTSPMGWQTTIWHPADINAPGAVIKVDVRCPDCAA